MAREPGRVDPLAPRERTYAQWPKKKATGVPVQRQRQRQLFTSDTSGALLVPDRAVWEAVATGGDGQPGSADLSFWKPTQIFVPSASRVFKPEQIEDTISKAFDASSASYDAESDASVREGIEQLAQMRSRASIRELHKLWHGARPPSRSGARPSTAETAGPTVRRVEGSGSAGGSARDLQLLLGSLGLTRHFRRLRKQGIGYDDLATVIALPTMKGYGFADGEAQRLMAAVERQERQRYGVRDPQELSGTAWVRPRTPRRYAVGNRDLQDKC